MNPDNILKKYSKKHPKIKIWLEEDMVFIEGQSKSLELLGRILIAQSKYKKDCGFQISPTSAGKIFFRRSSTHGIYIHRVPCKHKNK